MLRGHQRHPGCTRSLMPRHRAHVVKLCRARWDESPEKKELSPEEMIVVSPRSASVVSVAYCEVPRCLACRFPSLAINWYPRECQDNIRTINCRTNPSIFVSICACSLSLTACGGENNFTSPFSSLPKIALLMTQHHMGIVLLNASGILFPLLVLSTTTAPP